MLKFSSIFLKCFHDAGLDIFCFLHLVAIITNYTSYVLVSHYIVIST